MRARPVMSIAALGLLLASVRPVPAQPVVVEAGWTLTAELPVSAAGPAVFSEDDGALYYGQYQGGATLFQRAVDGLTRPLTTTGQLGGLMVGPDGSLYVAEFSGGELTRVTLPSGAETTWITDLHDGDDDPTGMTLVPAGHSSSLASAGEGLVVDAGVGGSEDGIFAFSLEAPDALRVLHGDAEPLDEATDIAVTPNAIYVSDAGTGGLWRLSDATAPPNVTLVAQSVTPELDEPRAVEFDPTTGTLLVADRGTGSVLRLAPDIAADSWTATVVVSGLSFRSNHYQNVALRADGSQLVVSAESSVLILTRCDASSWPSLSDCDGDGVADVCNLAAGDAADCNANGVPDGCELEANESLDCDDDQRPDECATCGLLDLVLVVATSASMQDEARALCDQIVELGDALAYRGVDADIQVLGIAGTPGGAWDCLDGDVAGTFGSVVPDLPPPVLAALADCSDGGNPAQDWARAVAVVAGRMDDNIGTAAPQWRDGAVRLVVPIAGAGPFCGDPVDDPGVDRDAVLHAAAVAGSRGVQVVPLLSEQVSTAVVALGQLLAQQTGATSPIPAEATLVEQVVAITHRACFSQDDCNANETPDSCDIAAGISDDCDVSGVPDECERVGRDCNDNGTLDSCEVAAGADDCDANGVPDECPDCPAIDVLFLMDTSASMDDEAEALCGGIRQVAVELEVRGLRVNTSFFGISETPGGAYSCLTHDVISAYGTTVPGEPGENIATLGDCPGDSEVASEDWARAVAVAADQHPWTPGALRLIVPIADEGPWCGNPVNADDRAATDHALRVAQQAGVFVSPIVPSDASASVLAEAVDLARGSGGQVFDLSRPDTDVTRSVIGSIVDACRADYDCDDDGVPDSCERAADPGLDCDGNQVLDSCELARGVMDCNANLVPDVCDIAALAASDCDDDGMLDACQLVDGSRSDCNGNDRPDRCDVASGDSPDLDLDGLPDECQRDDCNANGVDDSIDIAAGTSGDCNSNLRPDECDVAGAASSDLTFDVTSYGVAGEPGVVRDGFDKGSADRLGYEGASPSTDPLAVVGPLGDVASPLRGDYAVDYERSGSTIAVTEFCNNVTGVDTNDEWIELFNYGGQPVSLAGWRLRDGGSDDTPLPDFEMQPGQLAIIAESADNFIERFGVDASEVGVRVFGLGDWGALENGSDEIILLDGSGSVAWSLAYENDEVEGVATHLVRHIEVLPQSDDCDDDEVPDECQADCDGNGAADSCDVAAGAPDCDGNGVPDGCDLAAGAPDCDVNGVPDGCDLLNGAADCDANGVLDRCEVVAGVGDCDGDGLLDRCAIDAGADDCDANGVPDGCDREAGAADCDANDRLDVCDIADGASDCDANGVPDRCDLGAGAADCDANGVPDVCDLAAGAIDCDGNGVPDQCDLSAGGADCDANDALDVCELAAGAADCDANGVLDVCDLSAGTPDCDADGVPDACELAAGAPDCNANGVLDVCDLVDGAGDCDANGVPDDCDPDCNANAIADACEDLSEVCDGEDNDCDGVVDADDPDLQVVPCGAVPGCPIGQQTWPVLCVDGQWQPCVCATDGDGDGVPDGVDNCPDQPNPDQADGDADGIGDACTETQAEFSGNGACQASGDGGPGWWWIVLAAWVLFSRRRSAKANATPAASGM